MDAIVGSSSVANLDGTIAQATGEVGTGCIGIGIGIGIVIGAIGLLPV